MISEDRLEKALKYLATTDEELAGMLDEMERAEFKAKAVRDEVFVFLDGEKKYSVSDRQAMAGISSQYRAAQEEYFAKRRIYNATLNKRKTESIVVDVWRSLNASRRQGNV